MPWFIFSHMFSQCDGQQVTLMWAYVLSDTPLQLQACGQKEPLHQSHLTRMATGVSFRHIKIFPLNGRTLQIFEKNVYDWCAAFLKSIVPFASINQTLLLSHDRQKTGTYAAPQQILSQETSFMMRIVAQVLFQAMQTQHFHQGRVAYMHQKRMIISTMNLTVFVTTT